MRGVERGGGGGGPKTAKLQLEERENRNTAYPNTETAVTNGIKLALSRLQIRLLSRDVYISLDKKVNVLIMFAQYGPRLCN